MGGGGLCPSCKIQWGGDYVLVVKFSGGDYVLVVKFMGGILSTYTKMNRGVLSGGILSYTRFNSYVLFDCLDPENNYNNNR